MKRIVLACLAVALLLAPSPAGAGPGDRKSYVKTHAFGPDSESKVGIRQGPVTIESVRIRNWPDADDFADAERDLGETNMMVVEFEYSNRDEARDWKCRYTVRITGKDGSVWAENDRTATLDSGKIHDTNKMFVKMKTRYYKQVRSFEVTYEIWRSRDGSGEPVPPGFPAATAAPPLPRGSVALRAAKRFDQRPPAASGKRSS